MPSFGNSVEEKAIFLELRKSFYEGIVIRTVIRTCGFNGTEKASGEGLGRGGNGL